MSTWLGINSHGISKVQCTIICDRFEPEVGFLIYYITSRISFTDKNSFMFINWLLDYFFIIGVLCCQLKKAMNGSLQFQILIYYGFKDRKREREREREKEYVVRKTILEWDFFRI